MHQRGRRETAVVSQRIEDSSCTVRRIRDVTFDGIIRATSLGCRLDLSRCSPEWRRGSSRDPRHILQMFLQPRALGLRSAWGAERCPKPECEYTVLTSRDGVLEEMEITESCQLGRGEGEARSLASSRWHR